MTNRLGRAIDRARALARESTSKNVQIKIITRRANWIRAAILFIVIAVFSAALFILSVASLIVSLIYFIVGHFQLVESDGS